VKELSRREVLGKVFQPDVSLRVNARAGLDPLPGVTIGSVCADIVRMNSTLNRTDGWMPIGTAVGSAVGHYLGDLTTGMALGMVAGGTYSMLLEFRSGKRSLVWPVFGAVSCVWILVAVLIERM
jgi:hypothetical protein